MLNIKVGSVWSWQPSAFDRTKDNRMPRTVRGAIIHVNAAHHCFTAEAIVNGYSVRETFKTI